MTLIFLGDQLTWSNAVEDWCDKETKISMSINIGMLQKAPLMRTAISC